MIEKVNPAHPDKVADRIAGAIVDLAYQKQAEPKIAVEVLIGHGVCHVIIESSCDFTEEEIAPIINRIAGENRLDLCCVRQDIHLILSQVEIIHGNYLGIEALVSEFICKTH